MKCLRLTNIHTKNFEELDDSTFVTWKNYKALSDQSLKKERPLEPKQENKILSLPKTITQKSCNRKKYAHHILSYPLIRRTNKGYNRSRKRKKKEAERRKRVREQLKKGKENQKKRKRIKKIVKCERQFECSYHRWPE